VAILPGSLSFGYLVIKVTLKLVNCGTDELVMLLGKWL
jgi:hypothetical protein